VRRPNSAPRNTGTGGGPLRPGSQQPTSMKSRPTKAPKPAGSLHAEQQRLARLAKQDKQNQKSASKLQRLEIRKFTQGTRTRKILTFTTLGSVAVLASLVLATMFTPLMAIKDIQVSGTHRLKPASIKSAVSTLIGTPLTLVSEDDLAKRLSSFTLIQSFTTLSLPPHTLQINIVERQPVAIVQTTSGGYLYDPAGVLIGPTKATWKFPTVVVSGDPRHSSNYRAAIDVLLALPAGLYPKVQRIQATSKDDVRLELRGAANQQILWGDSSKSIMKSKVLAALIANTKKSAAVTYDVSSPGAPTVRYGRF
jgi:cell division protein FtsQ